MNINRCGFHIVEFFNEHHPDPNEPDVSSDVPDPNLDGMFTLRKKKIKRCTYNFSDSKSAMSILKKRTYFRAIRSEITQFKAPESST